MSDTSSMSRWQRAKHTVNRHLNPGEGDSRTVDSIIITVITFDVLAVMLETEPWPTLHVAAQGFEYYLPLKPDYHLGFFYFEWFSSIFFTIEYVLRIWVAPLNPHYSRPVLGRLRYVLTPMALVDLIAVLPFYLPMLIEMDLRIARAIRMFRLVRVLKMGRYAEAVRTLTSVGARKKEELAMTGFVLVLLLILCSSVIYFVEHAAQPEAFPSIPQSMWWAIITLTSVGYGDVYPITTMGRFFGAIVAMVGVGFVALPTGILASGFLEHMREKKRGKDEEIFGFCPHCGEQLLPGEELE